MVNLLNQIKKILTIQDDKDIAFLAFNKRDILLFKLIKSTLDIDLSLILCEKIENDLIENIKKTFNNINIIKLESLENRKNNVYLYTGGVSSVKSVLKKISYKQLIPFCANNEDNECIITNFEIPLLEKYDLDIHIIDVCNFDCKSCDHFSPIAKKANIVSPEKHRENLLLLKNIIGENKFSAINILGGEPLLNKDITEIIKITREIFNNQNITIITNGILLNKMQPKFYETLNDCDVSLSISVYQDNDINYNDIKETLIENNFTNYCFNKTLYSWSPSIMPIKKENIGLSYSRCPYVVRCMQLKNGKLFKCPIVAHIEHFNNYFDKNLEVQNYDYFELEGNSFSNLLLFLSNPTPFCSYCAIERNETVLWKKTCKGIDEWQKIDYENYNFF